VPDNRKKLALAIFALICISLGVYGLVRGDDRWFFWSVPMFAAAAYLMTGGHLGPLARRDKPKVDPWWKGYSCVGAAMVWGWLSTTFFPRSILLTVLPIVGLILLGFVLVIKGTMKNYSNGK
jgi:hypothetical protein